MEPKFKGITVPLTGKDGNAFFIISRVSSAMKKASVEKETIDKFRDEAMSGDYDNVLQTCMKYVSVT